MTHFFPREMLLRTQAFLRSQILLNTFTNTAQWLHMQRNAAKSPIMQNPFSTCIPFRSPEKCNLRQIPLQIQPGFLDGFSASPPSRCESVNRHRKFLCPRWNFSGYFPTTLSPFPFTPGRIHFPLRLTTRLLTTTRCTCSAPRVTDPPLNAPF